MLNQNIEPRSISNCNSILIRPGCQGFTTGALKNVLAKPDMVAIISLKLVAYGNTAKNADGSFTCQHGVGECESDSLELCAQYKLSGDPPSGNRMPSLNPLFWSCLFCYEKKKYKNE